ncbi:MAG: 4-hydroxy-tetrahydrodipicolinate reductase [Lachnospiraceae bacterium]|nr:4-hydroxy-tetrahydrodipicolinate reductase [Lachnospiraceae bacterium]
MTKIILRGCCGHMGQVITDIVANDADAEIVAGLDIVDNGKCTYPIFDSLAKVDVEADVVIDFSTPKGVRELISDAKAKNLPLVLCSTGYTKEEVDFIIESAKDMTILRSANMSLGVNTILKLVQAATQVLANDFDIEIVEKHHKLKKDAPSGTALAIADAINEVLNNEYEYVYDRSERSEQRPKKEIGLSAVRGGTIVGEHEVIFAGRDEVIEIKHTAYSKAIFGKGAVNAAKFLAGKPAGLYNMQDVIG